MNIINELLNDWFNLNTLKSLLKATDEDLEKAQITEESLKTTRQGFITLIEDLKARDERRANDLLNLLKLGTEKLRKGGESKKIEKIRNVLAFAFLGIPYQYYLAKEFLQGGIRMRFVDDLKKKNKERKILKEYTSTEELDAWDFISEYNLEEALKGFIEERKEKLKKKTTWKISVNSDLFDITRKVFKYQITKKDYKGVRDETLNLIGGGTMDLGPVHVWEKEDIETFIKATDFEKLKYKEPKIYVSQFKNIMALLSFVEEQNFKSPSKKAYAKFTFLEYAKRRGYTEEELRSGGKFFDELKRDLLTGAYATYRIKEIEIDGKKYIAHGIPNLYTLYEPEQRKGYWIVEFSQFYAGLIEKTLYGTAKHFFKYALKEVADRETTEKPHLHMFYRWLVKRLRDSRATLPAKVENIIKEIVMKEGILDRPKECYEILKDCLVYFHKNYPELMEKVLIGGDFQKAGIPLNIETIEKYEYEAFKEKFLIPVLKIDDIREAFISFVRGKEQGKLPPKSEGES